MQILKDVYTYLQKKDISLSSISILVHNVNTNIYIYIYFFSGRTYIGYFGSIFVLHLFEIYIKIENMTIGLVSSLFE
jgi:hypothetical protein